MRTTTVDTLLLACLLVLGSGAGARAEGAKDDFRGLRTGMDRAEARDAAARHGGRCGDVTAMSGSAQSVCEFGNESRAVLFFSSKGHITRIRVLFLGDFDDVEMQKYIIQSYRLAPDPLSTGSYTNRSADRFSFSRMGSDKYSLDIYSHDVAEKDGQQEKSRLPQL